MAEVDVNEEEAGWKMEGEAQFEENRGDFDLTKGGSCMTGSNVAEQLQRYSNSRACRCAWRGLQVRSHIVGAEDAIEDVRMVRRQGAWHSWQ